MVSPHRDCIGHPMCFCVFFLPKNTKTHRPNVSLSFFNIRIAPDRLCVFVFLSFFSTIRLHQRANVFLWFIFYEKLNDKFFLSFFQQHQRANVLVCFCIIFPKTPNVFVFLHQRARVLLALLKSKRCSYRTRGLRYIHP